MERHGGPAIAVSGGGGGGVAVVGCTAIPAVAVGARGPVVAAVERHGGFGKAPGKSKTAENHDSTKARGRVP
ncbi:hypothetical protein [Streptosporangium sp. V21-05]|uniref:hypothetical protein n=1 Tax=Streptosporangium sp. V21-05 TaxID=3446115 RepID=UPI003F532695